MGEREGGGKGEKNGAPVSGFQELETEGLP